MTCFRAGTRGQCQGHSTEHHRAGGHQNRAQTQCGGINHRFQFALALLLQLIGELDDHDAVFGNQADQGDHADLGVDVPGPGSVPQAQPGTGVEQHQTQERTEHRQRHRDQNHQRIDEALKLRSQHQINEYQRQQQHRGGAGSGLAVLARLAVQIILRTWRNLLQGVFHPAQRFTLRIAGRQAGTDHRRTHFIEVVEFLRRHRFRHRCQITHLHQTVAAAHVDIGQRFRGAAQTVINLHDDVILFGTLLEAGHVSAAEHGFQGAADRADIGADRGDLVAVHQHAQLGLVQFQIGIRIGQLRILLHLGQQFLDCAVQFFPSTGGLHHEADRLTEIILAERWRRDRERHQPGNAHELREQTAGDLLRGAGAVVPVLQADEADGGGDFAETDDDEGTVALDHVLEHLFHLLGVAIRVVDGGAFGCAGETDDQSLVFLRRQFFRQQGEQQRGGGEHCCGSDDYQFTQRQHMRQHAPVRAIKRGQHTLAPQIESAVLGFAAQQFRAHHRRQGQRGEARDQYGAGQGQGEFNEQFAGASGREREGQIYRGQGQCHGDDGEADFLAAFERRLQRRHAFFDVPVDVLEHHDGIVHHQADGQHHGQQTEDIDGEAEHVHDGERADQRDRYGHDRNQHSTPVAQEQEDHQHHQQHGLEHGDIHFADRFFDEDGGVVGDFHFHAGRQCAGDLRQHGLDGFGNFQRIGYRLLDDAERDGVLAVEAGPEAC